MKTAFLVLCFAHFAEHVAQIVQLYALGVPMHRAGGLVGLVLPWLVHSETLHLAYAVFMMWGLVAFFVPSSLWAIAAHIQLWHCVEHCVLFSQAVAGVSLLPGSTVPVSVLQAWAAQCGGAEYVGMQHFGVCKCAGASPGTIHNWSAWVLIARRPELHFLYNAVVLGFMLGGMWHVRRSAGRAS